jgi:uncharacterized protein YbjQ (UPF0145 family)
MSDDVLVSTMNDVPGYEVVQVHGEVYGLIVRARNVFSNLGAGLRTIVGGEARGYTKLLMQPPRAARTPSSRCGSTATRSVTS